MSVANESSRSRQWIVLSLLAFSMSGSAQPAAAVHLDVWVHKDAANRMTSGYFDVNTAAVIVSNARAIGYNFHEFDEDPYFADNPGFFAEANNLAGGSGLPGGSGVGYNILSDLKYWNGGGTPQLGTVPAGETLTFNLGSQNRQIGALTGPQAGFNIQNVRTGASEGSLHAHFNSLLNAGAGQPTPTVGIYAVQIELTSTAPGVAASLPFWVIFNNAAGEDKRGAMINQLYPNQWAGPLGGSFNTQLNWTGRIPVELGQIVPVPEVPNAVDAVARFFDNLAADSTITVDSPVTLGTLSFGSTPRYSLAGPATVSLQSATTARIELLTGSHTIAAPMHLVSSAAIVANGGTLDLTGPLGWNANRTLSVQNGTVNLASSSVSIGAGATLEIAAGATVNASGAANPLDDAAHRVAVANQGTLTIAGGGKTGGAITGQGNSAVLAGTQFTVDSLVQNAASVEAGGLLKIAPGGAAAVASRVTSLSLAGGAVPTATLDLSDNRIVIDYASSSPAAMLGSQIVSAFQNGSWGGPGITSSAAASANLAIGFAEATSVVASFPATWFGQAIDATAVLLRLTTFGDADLSGGTNFTDLGILLNHYNQAGIWENGDSNYDGAVNFTDLGVLLNNYNAAAPLGVNHFATPIQTVPEPRGLALIVVAAILILARRIACSPGH